ncbi:S-layer homology domain-containing protein [Paenibacillus sp. P25]|nr:S-layer homology domain-containing protein [Paenibacillus sp. P25]
MKTTVSSILSLAMAFSMVAGTALGAETGSVKDSTSFTDLKDLDAATKAKFDEMIKAGIFDGVKDGVFGIKEKMNRAQFAKVAALIFQLKVDTAQKSSTFSDVKADDPANGYALPYIEAIYKAGITDGYAPGQFNPAGEVTREQLAAFLLRGLNLDTQAKSTPGVSDKTVSDWARGYVALAIEKKLMTSGADGTFGGTSVTTRDMLCCWSPTRRRNNTYRPSPIP